MTVDMTIPDTPIEPASGAAPTRTRASNQSARKEVASAEPGSQHRRRLSHGCGARPRCLGASAYWSDQGQRHSNRRAAA